MGYSLKSQYMNGLPYFPHFFSAYNRKSLRIIVSFLCKKSCQMTLCSSYLFSSLVFDMIQYMRMVHFIFLFTGFIIFELYGKIEMKRTALKLHFAPIQKIITAGENEKFKSSAKCEYFLLFAR